MNKSALNIDKFSERNGPENVLTLRILSHCIVIVADPTTLLHQRLMPQFSKFESPQAIVHPIERRRWNESKCVVLCTTSRFIIIV